MRFDMHCHTREGSLDAKVGIESYIQRLIKKGFDGMLVTDHNSYKGYLKWKETQASSHLQKHFTVLKGIEYDTKDGGHMIAILPDEVHCKLLEIRGLSVARLEKLVHQLGGILGPAHPYGTGFFALMNNRWVKRHRDIIDKFDFIETFNSCIHPKLNEKAEKLAQKYKKTSFAGSDAHKSHIIGTACTTFDRVIRCNNDLIQAVKEKASVFAHGSQEEIPKKKESKLLKFLGVTGYWLYNQMGVFFYSFARKKEMKHY